MVQLVFNKLFDVFNDFKLEIRIALTFEVLLVTFLIVSLIELFKPFCDFSLNKERVDPLNVLFLYASSFPPCSSLASRQSILFAFINCLSWELGRSKLSVFVVSGIFSKYI